MSPTAAMVKKALGNGNLNALRKASALSSQTLSTWDSRKSEKLFARPPNIDEVAVAFVALNKVET
jgi:hypothetical protein